MELISASDEGTPGNRASMDGDISADGRWVVFTSLANNLVANQPVRCIRSSFDGFCPQVFVRDRQESRTYLVSLDWNGQAVEAFAPALTSDGRYVTFVSAADHLAIDLPSIEDDPSWPVYTFISDLFALLDMQK